MRNVFMAVLAASLIAVPGLGMADTGLSAGKPAGVKRAQLTENPIVIVAVVAAVGVGIGLAVSGDSASPTPVTPPVTTPSTT
jgi:hypothetical protein